ncbi:MAG: hypothetical protein Kow0059_19320 [Candidatus Sumerlaeia bacterium]
MPMRRLAVFLLCLFAVSFVRADDPPELRAFYVPTFSITSRAACDAVIDFALSHNVNAVFVQVRARGDAYYYPNREDSTYANPEPRTQLYSINPPDLDILQLFIDRCHGATPPREVHAWLTTYNTWNRTGSAPASPAHVFNAHPDWITENRAGVTYTAEDDAPLDPGIPAVQDYLFNIFLDVVRNYDVDGIHFDYIRLLGTDSGFDPVARAAFKAQTGWDFDTENPAGELDEVYEMWRRDQVARLVQRVTRQARLEKPWVEVSAFLVNFTDSVENLAQGYNWWVKYGAIDVLHPGCYASSVSSTLSDWQFFMDKLGQNGDKFTRPAVAAVGNYLLDSAETLEVVNTLRTNSATTRNRPADGFNFFAYADLVANNGEEAQVLFGPGGPFDDWAPVPPIAHKTDEESVPPNPPAALNVALAGGTPRISFERPAAASDGDQPVHYRLYRDSKSPVDLNYANLVMEWWDPGAARSSFTFDDLTAGGTVYYAAVAYDDWNNRAAVEGGPVTAAGGVYIIETRAGGQNVGDYSESGVFSNSSSHSTAPGCTSGIGSRFALPGDANGRADRARFSPGSLAAGTYRVFVTCFNFSSANAQGITVRVNDAAGERTSLFDLTAANAGNAWAEVATMTFTPGSGHYIEFDNSTQTNIGDSTNSRMNAAAVRFEPTGPGGAWKEPKPPVSPSAGGATVVVVDSHPVTLEYDDNGGSGHWADAAAYTGYWNANARYYNSANLNGAAIKSYALWVADLPQAGRWAIDGWTRFNNTVFARGARYRFVDAAGNVHNTTASQRSATNSTTEGDWLINVDGVDDADAWTFNAGRVYVTLWGNATGAEYLIADALRFRWLGPPAGQTPTPTPTPTPAATPTPEPSPSPTATPAPTPTPQPTSSPTPGTAGLLWIVK